MHSPTYPTLAVNELKFELFLLKIPVRGRRYLDLFNFLAFLFFFLDLFYHVLDFNLTCIKVEGRYISDTVTKPQIKSGKSKLTGNGASKVISLLFKKRLRCK
jgi:hypothetical protein